MRSRCILGLLIVFGIVLLDASGANLSAAPIQVPVLPAISTHMHPAVKVGYGCGWDYPCPPRPSYRAHRYRAPGELYIRNNYGTVNVFVNRRTVPLPSAGPVPVAVPDARPCCGAAAQDDARSAEERRCDRDAPCDSNCGPGCWYDRFKQGYCGHGCDVYREKVRFEKAERKYEYPKPVYYRDPPPAPVVEETEEPAVRYEREPIEERVPRRRFEGPPYPRCPNGEC